MSRASQLAEAVAADLNAADFALEFTARALRRVKIELSDAAALSVSVAPAGRSRETTNGPSDRVDIELDVAVRRKTNPDSPADFDPLDDLNDAIEDYLLRRGFATASAGSWICTAARTVEGAEPGYAIEHLDRPRAYTGLLRYRFHRR